MRESLRTNLKHLKRLIQSFYGSGIDGWDIDLLNLIKYQQEIIEELVEAVEKMEERVELLAWRLQESS